MSRAKRSRASPPRLYIRRVRGETSISLDQSLIRPETPNTRGGRLFFSRGPSAPLNNRREKCIENRFVPPRIDGILYFPCFVISYPRFHGPSRPRFHRASLNPPTNTDSPTLRFTAASIATRFSTYRRTTAVPHCDPVTRTMSRSFSILLPSDTSNRIPTFFRMAPIELSSLRQSVL